MKGQQVYLYGLIPSNIKVPDIQGVANPPLKVEVYPLDGVSLLVSHLPEDSGELSFEDTVKHFHVLEAIMRETTVLPFRFGTVTASLSQVADMLKSRHGLIEQELKRLEGFYEVGLKAYWKKDAILKELNRRYGDHRSLVLKAQLDREAAIELGQRVEQIVNEWRGRLSKRILPELNMLATASHTGESTTVEMLLNLSFLVNAGQEAKLNSRVQGFGEEFGEQVEFHYTTGLPPYNFTKLELNWGPK